MMQLGSVIHRRVRNGLRLSMVLAWGSPWARPIPLSVGDQVTVPGDLPGTFDPVVVARGGDSPTGACLYDRLRKGRGTLDIGQLVPKANCVSDVLLFAQGRAMTATPRVWLPGAELVQLPSPPVRVKVEFSMVLVAKGSQAAQQAGLDTVRAIQLFNRNRVGLTFHASRIIQGKQVSSADAMTIGSGCDKAKLNSLALRADLYDANRLNVYFVPGSAGGWRGWNCYTDGYPNVIYMSIAGESPASLAHELGHALGLQDSPEHMLGHTGAGNNQLIVGFVYQNLMWTNLYDQQALEQSHFSIGQGYRMNMDKISWVNRAGIVPGRVGLTCHPLAPRDSIPCPFLALDTVPS